MHCDVLNNCVLIFIGIIRSNFIIIEPITALFKLKDFSPWSAMISRSLDYSIIIWTPVMYAKSFNDRFSMEYSFLYISIWRIFKGAILVKVFKPPLVCTNSNISLVQAKHFPTKLILFPTLSVEHVYRRIQLMGISQGFLLRKAKAYFNRTLTILPFPLQWRYVSVKLNYIFSDLP